MNNPLIRSLIIVVSVVGSFQKSAAGAFIEYDSAYGRAFIFDEGLSDLTEASTTPVTNSIDHSGQRESIFSDELIPEPSTIAFALIGLMGLFQYPQRLFRKKDPGESTV